MYTDQTYKNVAEYCSAYDCCDSDQSINKASDTDMSCTTCHHFNSSHHCELDLLDPIVENHNIS